MSIKYSLKDVMLEAGVLDYRAAETDVTWVPSDKHKRAMDKIYKKEKDSKFTSLVKLLYGVAAAALLFIVIASVKPLREGAASLFSGFFGKVPIDTVTTEYVIKPADTGSVTETENITTETASETADKSEPLTDEEKIAAVIDDITDNGYTDDKWNDLQSYGEEAYLYCADMYFNSKSDQGHRTVYSVFCIELLAPEIKENMPAVAGRNEKTLSVTREVLKTKPYYGYHNELQKLRNALEELISPQWRKSDTYKKLYYTDLMLDLLDYSYYRAGSPDTPSDGYKPWRMFVSENVAYLKVHGLKAHNRSISYALMQYDDGIKEALDLYYETSDEKEKAIISVMLAICIQNYDSEDATQGGRMKLREFFGEGGYAYLTSINESTARAADENADISKYADWLDKFTVYLKEAASYRPEITVMEDREVCYKILQYLGFDGYYVCGEHESRIEGVLSEFMQMYNGITTGGVSYDKRDEFFSNQPGSENPLTEALIQKIKEFVPDYDPADADNGYPPYDFTYSTLKGDMRTADGLRGKFNDLLCDADVAESLAKSENENFLIVDGIVYMITGPGDGGYFTNAYIRSGSVKITGEDGDHYIVEAEVRWSKSRTEIHSFYVTKAPDQIKIKKGGSFFELYLPQYLYGKIK